MIVINFLLVCLMITGVSLIVLHLLEKNTKKNDTTITEFMVMRPTNDLEIVGERLKLSRFGKYRPERSRGEYSLSFLLDNPGFYAISEIIDRGQVIQINAGRETNYARSRSLSPLKFA